MIPRPVKVKKTRQVGFGLIEVMVAVLVLCLAFLAIGGLAARSLASNNGAMSFSVATIAVYSIQDAMRLDRANATGGAYNKTIRADNCPVAGTSLASKQLNLWCSNHLASPVLGGPIASTIGTIDCSSNGTCTITVTWNDSRSISNNQTVTTTGML